MAAQALVTPTALVFWMRRRLALQVSGLLVGDNDTVFADRPPVEEDPGLFGPDSVTWKVHADLCLLVGGLRALLLQTMHPKAMAGVAEHSNYRKDPLGRLANTTTYVGSVIYGTPEQATAAVARVKRVHERVVGRTPDGEPYAANDPHLLTWVHHTLVDSFLRAYRRYGPEPLSAEEADRYVAEQAVLAELFEAEPAARSVAELRAWFSAVRPELRATPAARDAARFLLVPPLPLHTRPAYGVVAAGAVAMLPGWVRRQLRLPVPPLVEPLVIQPANLVLFRTLGWVMEAHPNAS